MSIPPESFTIQSQKFTQYLSAQKIDQAISQLAQRINQDYQGKKIILVCVLKGAYVFCADLVRKLDHSQIEVQVEFVRLSSYGNAKESSGTVTLLKDISVDLTDQHVLIIEEIVDSGRTLRFLYDRLKTSHPASVEIVTLLDKKSKRIVEVPVKYAGLEIGDHFLIGYGLDLEEKIRNLPDIYHLSTEEKS